MQAWYQTYFFAQINCSSFILNQSNNPHFNLEITRRFESYAEGTKRQGFRGFRIFEMFIERRFPGKAVT